MLASMSTFEFYRPVLAGHFDVHRNVIRIKRRSARSERRDHAMIRALELTDRMCFETIVAGLERAWNAADGAAFAAYFTDDADFINIYGMHGKGRQAIADAHNLIFRTVYAGSHMRIRITQARLLAEDIALVHFASLLHVPGGPVAGEKKA